MLQIVASLSDDYRGVICDPIMLPENIYSTGVTYDDCHLLSSYFLVQATVDSRGVIYAPGEHL
jgi:hypothetical protein